MSRQDRVSKRKARIAKGAPPVQFKRTKPSPFVKKLGKALFG